MTEDLLPELMRYLGFTAETSRTLSEAYPRLSHRFGEVIEIHYARIVEHDGARAVLTGGEPQITRLKQTFRTWLDQCFAGPHDDSYFAMRSRIGTAHVRIGLPQRYMVTSMNVMRAALRRVVRDLIPEDERGTIDDAIDKVLALDLAIMLESYQADTLDRLARTERLATLGQVGASIGHELRNPLGVISSSAYLLRKSLSADARGMRHLTKIEQHVELANRSVADLLALVREAPPRLASWKLSVLIQEALEAAALPTSVLVERAEGDDPVVLADRGQTVQALRNVVSNAAEAMRSRGRIQIAHERTGAMVSVHVDDEGPGFAPAVMGRAFEPLVTTKPSGVGLGLALVRRYVELQGGKVTITNRQGRGARLTIQLPLAPQPHPDPAS